MFRQLGTRLLALGLAMVVASVALLPTPASGQPASTKLVLLHTSDYHSHAIPKYAEGQQNVGGLARVIQYLRDERQADPNAIILSGGDSMNLGTPSWSDKYQCAEWPLFNGLQDAMAFGNHELDYGWQTFEACKASAEYPILSANFVGADGQPILTPYVVLERGGIKLGLFSVAGDDFEKLVKPADRPEGAKFLSADELTPQIVKQLREVEKVDAVIQIGHRLYEEDVKLAQAVPGIDIILGTHSHRKEELKQIPGTSTWL